jgi:hypothetical protein
MELELYFSIDSVSNKRPESSSPQGILLHTTRKQGEVEIVWALERLAYGLVGSGCESRSEPEIFLFFRMTTIAMGPTLRPMQ